MADDNNVTVKRLDLLDQLAEKQREMRSKKIALTPVEQAMLSSILARSELPPGRQHILTFFSTLFQGYFNRGRIQVGVGEARSRKTNRLSQSAQRERGGRAQPTRWTLRWAYILYTNVAT
jgi:hypothetical protein